MKLMSLILSSIIYLFYLDNNKLIFKERIILFLRIDSLRRHINDIYLSYLNLNVSLLCLYSLYNISLNNINYFKNHAITIYNVFLSK